MLSHSLHRPWFQARTHFWGWNPITWEGWITLGTYFVGLLGWLGYVAGTRDLGVAIEVDPMPLVPIVLMTAMLMVLCKLKSERVR